MNPCGNDVPPLLGGAPFTTVATVMCKQCCSFCSGRPQKVTRSRCQLLSCHIEDPIVQVRQFDYLHVWKHVGERA